MDRMYKHIIWDWNGTLFNDTWLCLEIMNGQLTKIGKPVISYDEYQRLFDFPVRNFYEKIGFDFSQESYESVARNFIQEYTERRLSCSLHSGVVAMLTKLHQAGCDHSILSAYAEDALLMMLEHYGVRPFFSHIMGLNNHYASGKVAEGKILLEKLAMPIHDIVLIGDTVHDFEVAKELGVASILVANGHNSRLKLETCHVPVVRSFSEAMALIVR
jgi:phosphoglycolate phosphatase